MRKTAMAIVALLALAVSGSAFAEVRKDADAKIQYEIPEGFKTTVQGNMVAIDEPKHELAFLVVRTDEADVQKTMGELDKMLSSIIKDVKPVGDMAKDKLNGMDAVLIKATGVQEGKPVNLSLAFIKAPSGKIVVVIGSVQTAKKDAWTPVAQRFVKSIKPAQ